MAPVSLCAPLLLLALLTPAAASAQAPATPAAAYPVGVSVAGGAGALGLRDESISSQRYSGTLPYLAAAWTADHQGYLFRVGAEFRQSDRIRNHNVSTRITRFALGQSYLYRLAPRRIAGRPVRLCAGPLTGIAVYTNEQHITVDALGFAQSVCVLLSLGARGDALVPLTARLTAHGSLRASLLSLGVRAVDDEIDDSSPARLLTPWSGVDLSFETGVLGRVSERFTFGVAYLFQLTRVSSWNPLLMASDSLVARLTCRL
ncbi:MAG: hypothetical protein ABIL09_04445 [Gemmatimonadota bacterium]